MPPKSKKRRLNQSAEDTSNSVPAPIIPNRNTWPGWCEIESEPAFFNVMLYDMGVRGVKIQEVFGLDDELLAILPRPVYAMIFLCRYREIDKDKQEATCPGNVWFANQIPDFACATVALLNIVNNIPGLELGPHLQSFKDFSQSFDPLSRGDAIVSFDFVRKIHNSFARSTDMLNVDHLMKDKYTAAMRKQRLESANAARAAKAAEKAAQKAAEKAAKDLPTNGTPRSNLPRKARNGKVAEAEDSTEDEGYHFIAYMPIDNEVWKLDGMDSFPQRLGKIPEDSDWLSVVQTALTIRMAQYEEGQIEFSLMAVVKDPVEEDREALALNIKCLQCVESKLTEVSPGWKDFLGPNHQVNIIDGPNEEFGITEDAITFACPSDNFMEKLDNDNLEYLMVTRQETITAQAGIRAAVRDHLFGEQADAEKARHRRHDYGSFVQAWLEALAKADALVPLVEKVAGKK